MKNKAKVNRRNVVLVISLVVLLLIIVVMSPIRNKLQGLIVSKEKELKSIANINIEWQEGMEIKTYGDKVIVVDGKNINLYGHSGKKIWSKKLKDQEEIYLGDSAFFINNKKNMEIDKFDLEGIDVWSYKTRHPSYTMTEIENQLIVYLKVDENTRSIVVLDKDGKLILEKQKNKEEILSSNISRDRNKVIITSIDTSSQELKSKVTYLKQSGETIWTEEVKDRIIYNVLFLDRDKLILIGDKEIICKDEEGKTLWKKDIKYSFKDIEIIDNKEIYILYGIEDSYLEVLDLDGKLNYKKTFNKEYSHIGQIDKQTVLIGKGGVLSLSDSKINMEKDLKGGIEYIKISNDDIVVVKDKKIEIFKLADKKNK